MKTQNGKRISSAISLIKTDNLWILMVNGSNDLYGISLVCFFFWHIYFLKKNKTRNNNTRSLSTISYCCNTSIHAYLFDFKLQYHKCLFPWDRDHTLKGYESSALYLLYLNVKYANIYRHIDLFFILIDCWIPPLSKKYNFYEIIMYINKVRTV